MKAQPQVSPKRRSQRSAPAAPAGSGEELLHELRNILAGMTYGMNALADAYTRGNEQAVADLHRAMLKQVDLLRSAVAEAARQVRAQDS